MKYSMVFLTLLFLVPLCSCQSMDSRMEEIRSEREEAVIRDAKEYFLAAGGKLDQYPGLFDPKKRWSKRAQQARLVLYNLGQDETVPASFSLRMAMYFAIMLSEASHGELDE